MQYIFEQFAKTKAIALEHKKYLVLVTGAVTFFFGFAAGALLNMYLLFVHSPLVLTLRSSLNYQSAIFGDGILLPIVNMVVVAFLLKNKNLVGKTTIKQALFAGGCITIYFHISQAVNKLVNWAMPTPWHWNFLGVWHAAYMFSVTSLLSLFYIVVIKKIKKEKYLPREVVIVSVGIIFFFVLLRLDYITISFSSMLPKL